MNLSEIIHFLQQLKPEDLRRSSSIHYETSTVNEEHDDLVIRPLRSRRGEPATLNSVDESRRNPILVPAVDRRAGNLIVGRSSIEESSRLREITSSEIKSSVTNDEIREERSTNRLGDHSSDEVVPYELDRQYQDCIGGQ